MARFALILMLFCTPVLSREIMTAEILMRTCLNEAPTMQEHCYGALNMFGAMELQEYQYCPPPGSNVVTGKSTFISYILKNQHRYGEAAPRVLLDAYRAAWPCER